jgi:fumarate hydratase class II
MGAVEVPESEYWGAQTQRYCEQFAIGDELLPISLVHAYALVKQAASKANGTLGELSADRAAWIASAAQEVVEGAFDAHFPLRVWQTGSGTQTNMNLNEVIANRANELAGGVRGDKEPVHPNDHVNRGQSTNDTFPTAMHVSAALRP